MLVCVIIVMVVLVVDVFVGKLLFFFVVCVLFVNVDGVC